MATRHLLKVVVTYGRRGTQGGRHIPGFQQAALLGGVRPDPGQAIRLKLDHDGDGVRRPRVLLLQTGHFAFNAQDILHVVSDFVRQDVRLGKLAWGTEPLLELIVEG